MTTFYIKVRTTNDVEGWHNSLHNHAGQKYSFNGLNMYLVLDVLYCESVQVDKNVARMRQGQKLRRVNKTYKALNTKLFSLWKQHAKSVITTEKLLSECAECYTSVNASKYAKSPDDDRELELESQ